MKKLRFDRIECLFERISKPLSVKDKLRLKIILLALLSIKERAMEIGDKVILEELSRIGVKEI